MNLIARQDGSTSRTKITNVIAIVSAVVMALPAIQGLIPAWIYSVLLAGFAGLQQHYRNSQTAL